VQRTEDELSPFLTFRDPAGSIELRADGAYRRVLPPYDAEILAFLETRLAEDLVAQSRLIASEVLLSAGSSHSLLLRHPRIAFQSYPWEWPPALWLAAAELTLDLCRDLVKEGWILKDATPLNVLFRGTEPIFVDVLSICRTEPDQPVWYAYAQFVRMFLLQMLAYAKLGWALQATLMRRDGYEPEELYSALPWYARFRQPALSTVTLPRMIARRRVNSRIASRLGQEPEIVRQVILRTLSTLSRQIKKITPDPSTSTWSLYPETASHYNSHDHAVKRDFTGHALNAAKPKRVLDVGCNLGIYSLQAADAGAEVVAIDTDLKTVDRLSGALKGTGKNILPLCVDLARPTPAVGWENRENSAFLDRGQGSFDMVMMLAVIHHLLIGDQIPLDKIAALCDTITTRHLIVEWVPPTDPKFRQISRGRDALCSHLTEGAFRAAFALYFRSVREVVLRNGRILFHFEKR